MQQKQREVIFLKPTPCFLSFLKAYLSPALLPAFELLQTDVTAYTFSSRESDDCLLEAIELYFPTMFQYELERWIGVGQAADLNATFFDFLCCFKFEVNSEVWLLEPNLLSGKYILRIKPSLVLITSFKNLDEVQPFIERYFPPNIQVDVHTHLLYLESD